MLQKQEHNAERYTLAFHNGREKGLAWFFRHLYPALTLYCYNITNNKEASEEIASGAFTKIWQRHEQFTNAFTIKAYLYRTVRNDAFKYLRGQKQQAAKDAGLFYLFSKEHQQDHFAALVTSETVHQLSTAIKTLPHQCSKVFHLLYIEGRSIKETASILGLAPTTVKTQKARGLQALRKVLRPTLLFFAQAIVSLQLTIFK